MADLYMFRLHMVGSKFYNIVATSRYHAVRGVHKLYYPMNSLEHVTGNMVSCKKGKLINGVVLFAPGTLLITQGAHLKVTGVNQNV